jgi:hypothetical protein
MTVRILVVDDEPDLEGLLVQKFRHQSLLHFTGEVER